MGKKQSKISTAEFNDILSGTKFTKEEINEWFAKFKKEFPKGKIKKPEFLAMYQKLFPDGDATEFTDHIFRIYDDNKDGVIDFHEFMTTVSIAQRGTTEEKLRWAFRLYDLDGNGKLTKDELENVLASIYKAKNQPDPKDKAKSSAEEFLTDIDSDKDGFITEDEFINEISKCHSLRELLQGF